MIKLIEKFRAFWAERKEIYGESSFLPMVIIVVCIVTGILISVRLGMVLDRTTSSNTSSVKEPLGKVVLIDPGHGGVDGGTSAGSLLEKDINLQFSLHMYDMLKFMGYRAVMTRKGDYSIHDAGADTIREKKKTDLKNRLVMYNSSRLVLSFHQNYYSSPKYGGVQMLYGGKNSESQTIATALQLKLVDFLKPPENKIRDIKEGPQGVFLLRETSSPAVIIECGFMSNGDDLKQIQSKEYQQKFCYTLLAAIMEYNLGIEP